MEAQKWEVTKFVTSLADSDMFSLPVEDAGRRAAEGEQQHAAKNRDDTAVAGLGNIVLAGVGLPGGGVGHGLGHGVGDLGRPADEGVALAGGLAVERGCIGAGQQVVINLIGKGLALYAVGVSNRVLIFLVVGNAVAVGVRLPGGGVNSRCTGFRPSRTSGSARPTMTDMAYSI